MRGSKGLTARGRKQRGASAIEFALLFPFLFAVIYGGITYGFVYVLQQRINFAAQEGVRAAIAVDPAASDYINKTQTAAVDAAKAAFTGAGAITLPAALLPTAQIVAPDNNTIRVTVTFNLAGAPASGGGAATGPLFPTIDLSFIGIGPVPSLPSALLATAVGRLS